jgi:hypothetical protein
VRINVQLLTRIALVALVVAALVPIDGGPTGAAARLDASLEAAAQRAIAIARGDTIGATSAASAAGDPSSTVTYIGYPTGSARPGETVTIPVALRNRDARTWPAGGEQAVKLSYHLYDAAGRVVAWDGPRSTLPDDLPAGGGDVIPMTVVAPPRTGTYTVKPDLVRDGLGWFSSAGAAPGSFPLRVTTDLDAGYGMTTAPAAIVPGGEVPVEVRVTNTGLQTWPAGGDTPVRLGYHWLDGSGKAVVWDGTRVSLPRDVAPGREMSFAVNVRAPDHEGDYVLAWDMVQDGGVGWFSGHAVPTKSEIVAVWSDGVTFYGKGWGHGIGLSQWGAQGWAQGAAGPRLTGEQIVATYFPSAHLASQPITQPFRVLLSAPSTGCIRHTIANVARMRSAGGMRLVNNADPNVVYTETAPNQPLRFWNDGGSLAVRNDSNNQIVFFGADTVVLMPKQAWDPIYIDQKDLSYRGNLQVGLRDEGNLRVVNYVSSDDYMRGALPGEMPAHWEMEALRAQAITARTYAAWRQSNAGERTWDVRDDTADQCYGGYTFESARTSPRWTRPPRSSSSTRASRSAPCTRRQAAASARTSAASWRRSVSATRGSARRVGRISGSPRIRPRPRPMTSAAACRTACGRSGSAPGRSVSRSSRTTVSTSGVSSRWNSTRAQAGARSRCASGERAPSWTSRVTGSCARRWG